MMIYDKFYIEADEVNSPGTENIIGRLNLLQKLNKPGGPLKEEIDIEELIIIGLKDENDLIDSEIIRKVSSGRSKLSQTIKVHPNSPQDRDNIEQVIQEYLAQNLMNAKEWTIMLVIKIIKNLMIPMLKVIICKELLILLRKLTFRPHNPIYRLFTPPVRNLAFSNVIRGGQQQYGANQHLQR